MSFKNLFSAFSVLLASIIIPLIACDFINLFTLRSQGIALQFIFVFVLFVFAHIRSVSHIEKFFICFHVFSSILILVFNPYDYSSLFLIFWELSCIASASLMSTRNAFIIYAVVHCLSGGFVISGLYASMDEMTCNFLLLLGVLINCAVFPLCFWVPCAYPNSHVNINIILQLFTTKSALFVLNEYLDCTGDLFFYLGVLTSGYGLLLSLMCSDIRKLLAYNTVGQCGVCVTMASLGVDVLPFLVVSCIYQSAMYFIVSDLLMFCTDNQHKAQFISHKFFVRKANINSILFCAILVFASMNSFPFTQGYLVKIFLDLQPISFTYIVSGVLSAVVGVRFIVFCCSFDYVFNKISFKRLWPTFIISMFCILNFFNFSPDQFQFGFSNLKYLALFLVFVVFACLLCSNTVAGSFKSFLNCIALYFNNLVKSCFKSNFLSPTWLQRCDLYDILQRYSFNNFAVRKDVSCFSLSFLLFLFCTVFVLVFLNV